MSWHNILNVGLFIGLFFALIYALRCLDMFRNPKAHTWPSVARCHICRKRIYVWQKTRHRPFIDDPDNPDNYVKAVQTSKPVHQTCKGKPVKRLKVRVR